MSARIIAAIGVKSDVREENILHLKLTRAHTAPHIARQTAHQTAQHTTHRTYPDHITSLGVHPLDPTYSMGPPVQQDRLGTSGHHSSLVVGPPVLQGVGPTRCMESRTVQDRRDINSKLDINNNVTNNININGRFQNNNNIAVRSLSEPLPNSRKKNSKSENAIASPGRTQYDTLPSHLITTHFVTNHFVFIDSYLYPKYSCTPLPPETRTQALNRIRSSNLW